MLFNTNLKLEMCCNSFLFRLMAILTSMSGSVLFTIFFIIVFDNALQSTKNTYLYTFYLPVLCVTFLSRFVGLGVGHFFNKFCNIKRSRVPMLVCGITFLLLGVFYRISSMMLPTPMDQSELVKLAVHSPVLFHQMLVSNDEQRVCVLLLSAMVLGFAESVLNTSSAIIGLTVLNQKIGSSLLFECAYVPLFDLDVWWQMVYIILMGLQLTCLTIYVESLDAALAQKLQVISSYCTLLAAIVLCSSFLENIEPIIPYCRKKWSLLRQYVDQAFANSQEVSGMSESARLRHYVLTSYETGQFRKDSDSDEIELGSSINDGNNRTIVPGLFNGSTISAQASTTAATTSATKLFKQWDNYDSDEDLDDVRSQDLFNADNGSASLPPGIIINVIINAVLCSTVFGLTVMVFLFANRLLMPVHGSPIEFLAVQRIPVASYGSGTGAMLLPSPLQHQFSPHDYLHPMLDIKQFDSPPHSAIAGSLQPSLAPHPAPSHKPSASPSARPTFLPTSFPSSVPTPKATAPAHNGPPHLPQAIANLISDFFDMRSMFWIFSTLGRLICLQVFTSKTRNQKATLRSSCCRLINQMSRNLNGMAMSGLSLCCLVCLLCIFAIISISDIKYACSDSSTAPISDPPQLINVSTSYNSTAGEASQPTSNSNSEFLNFFFNLMPVLTGFSSNCTDVLDTANLIVFCLFCTFSFFFGPIIQYVYSLLHGYPVKIWSKLILGVYFGTTVIPTVVGAMVPLRRNEPDSEIHKSVMIICFSMFFCVVIIMLVIRISCCLGTGIDFEVAIGSLHYSDSDTEGDFESEFQDDTEESSENNYNHRSNEERKSLEDSPVIEGTPARVAFCTPIRSSAMRASGPHHPNSNTSRGSAPSSLQFASSPSIDRTPQRMHSATLPYNALGLRAISDLTAMEQTSRSAGNVSVVDPFDVDEEDALAARIKRVHYDEANDF